MWLSTTQFPDYNKTKEWELFEDCKANLEIGLEGKINLLISFILSFID